MFSFAVEPSSTCLLCAKAPLYSREVLEVYFGRSEVKMAPVKGDMAVYSKGSIENIASEVGVAINCVAMVTTEVGVAKLDHLPVVVLPRLSWSLLGVALTPVATWVPSMPSALFQPSPLQT